MLLLGSGAIGVVNSMPLLLAGSGPLYALTHGKLPHRAGSPHTSWLAAWSLAVALSWVGVSTRWNGPNKAPAMTQPTILVEDQCDKAWLFSRAWLSLSGS